jgi:hypothetical protein
LTQYSEEIPVEELEQEQASELPGRDPADEHLAAGDPAPRIQRSDLHDQR